MCTLKGTCQYTLFDIGGVEIHAYKRSKQCQRCRRYTTLYKDFNALNAMYVEDGVFSFYATLRTVAHLLMSKVLKVSNTMHCTLYTGSLAPPGGKAI